MPSCFVILVRSSFMATGRVSRWLHAKGHVLIGGWVPVPVLAGDGRARPAGGSTSGALRH